MSYLEKSVVEKALTDAGFEIYSSNSASIQLAERIRYHIMDSGVCVHVGETLRVGFIARCQRSDFPSESEEKLFERVRQGVGAHAGARGYQELSSKSVEVRNPSDESKILDVWYEVTFEKTMKSVEEVLQELKWALSTDKYVARS